MKHRKRADRVTAGTMTRPLMTRREYALEEDDREAGRHWRLARCWCGQTHEAGDSGLVDPPWSPSRDAEIPEMWPGVAR